MARCDTSATDLAYLTDRLLMHRGEPLEQAIAIMMEAHWRSAVHPDRVEGIGAFNEDGEPTFADPTTDLPTCGSESLSPSAG